jgi:hypothetical protein
MIKSFCIWCDSTYIIPYGRSTTFVPGTTWKNIVTKWDDRSKLPESKGLAGSELDTGCYAVPIIIKTWGRRGHSRMQQGRFRRQQDLLWSSGPLGIWLGIFLANYLLHLYNDFCTLQRRSVETFMSWVCLSLRTKDLVLDHHRPSRKSLRVHLSFKGT